MTKKLPDHLHAAHAWTEAAGELDCLRDLEGDELADYCRESADNNTDNGDGTLSELALLELHDWLKRNRPKETP